MPSSAAAAPGDAPASSISWPSRARADMVAAVEAVVAARKRGSVGECERAGGGVRCGGVCSSTGAASKREVREKCDMKHAMRKGERWSVVERCVMLRARHESARARGGFGAHVGPTEDGGAPNRARELLLLDSHHRADIFGTQWLCSDVHLTGSSKATLMLSRLARPAPL